MLARKSHLKFPLKSAFKKRKRKKKSAFLVWNTRACITHFSAQNNFIYITSVHLSSDNTNRPESTMTQRLL